MLIFFCGVLAAQEKCGAKFGNISVTDFAATSYALDSSASAVVIADVGTSKIFANSKGWFSIEFKRYRRVHLLNKNGFDVATEAVPLYTDGQDEEKLSSLKAVTYNLENGNVVETKLENENIFTDRLDKNWTVKKFAFPNIKEGSIVEFEYTINSDFLSNLPSWDFQGSYPTIWSEYDLTIPSFFKYVSLMQGFQKFYIQSKKYSQGSFTVIESNGTHASDYISFSSNVENYEWVVRNAPAIKEENYVSSLTNYKQKIDFELTEQTEPLQPHVFLSTWTQVAVEMMNNDNFGAPLYADNAWMDESLKPLTETRASSLEKAKRIYTLVRDNLTCTDYSVPDLHLHQTLKNVLKAHSGTVVEINLLLIGMLRHIGIDAEPVILSTRSHGYTYALYPIMNRFNYVICRATIDGQVVYLDASRPRLGFGKLTPACYNGHARIINSFAPPVLLSADSIKETRLTSLLLKSNEKGELIGSVQQIPGYFQSYEIRKAIMEKGKEEYFREVNKAYGTDVELANTHIDSVDNLEGNVFIGYDFKLDAAQEKLVYINPMFGEAIKENPFKSAERYYPVEMPYATDQTYIFTMFIPDGYEVEDLPNSVIVKLNDQDDGEFEYRISQTGGAISMRCRIQLKRAYYPPAEYDILREFYNLIVKKQSEPIVLRKKT